MAPSGGRLMKLCIGVSILVYWVIGSIPLEQQEFKLPYVNLSTRLERREDCLLLVVGTAPK